MYAIFLVYNRSVCVYLRSLYEGYWVHIVIVIIIIVTIIIILFGSKYSRGEQILKQYPGVHNYMC